MSDIASVIHEGEEKSKRKRIVLFGYDANTIPYLKMSLRNSTIALLSTSMGFFLLTSNLRRGVIVGMFTSLSTYVGTTMYFAYNDYNRYLRTAEAIKNNEVLFTDGSVQLDDSD
ncbi:uncharacterized protein LOC125652369 [Ostrea edulis]|uniref:uncharacterized protein LOC125652369 n=1 Tax=Ostrea edulis TaxID=37623 RepID=UPI0024AFC5FC|nr:uncharacterized protein LOC125652369 [Ostrea edulis]